MGLLDVGVTVVGLIVGVAVGSSVGGLDSGSSVVGTTTGASVGRGVAATMGLMGSGSVGCGVAMSGSVNDELMGEVDGTDDVVGLGDDGAPGGFSCAGVIGTRGSNVIRCRDSPSVGALVTAIGAN